jgi:hypothetical protein
MTNNQINIRDPFVLFENEKYYMYVTRGENFGQKTGGFDVYVSTDLENWSEPIECFNSDKYNMNTNVNWAPEVHKYKDNYYMFATFTKLNGLRGTYILKADSPLGEFKPHSNGAVTPEEWECLDGTLYINRDGKPYIIFCHEHTQIIDGTICYAPLNDDLTAPIGEPVTLFKASSPYWADKSTKNGIKIEVGVQYVSSALKGAYKSNSWYHRSGDAWIDRMNGSFNFNSPNNGIPEPDWILDNFLSGVHKWGDDPGQSYEHADTSTNTLMEDFFDTKLPNRINQYVQEELFSAITSRL